MNVEQFINTKVKVRKIEDYMKFGEKEQLFEEGKIKDLFLFKYIFQDVKIHAIKEELNSQGDLKEAKNGTAHEGLYLSNDGIQDRVIRYLRRKYSIDVTSQEDIVFCAFDTTGYDRYYLNVTKLKEEDLIESINTMLYSIQSDIHVTYLLSKV